MQDNLPVNDALDEPVVDGAYIESDLGISSRTRRTYSKSGILPPPDANLLGRNIWKQSTYRKFKADLLAGRFALLRRPPHLQGAAGLDERDASTAMHEAGHAAIVA